MNPKIDGKPVTVIITSKQQEEIARISKRRGIPKSEIYRMLLDVGIEMHKDMEKIGIITAVDFLYYCKQAITSHNSQVMKGKQLPLDF